MGKPIHKYARKTHQSQQQEMEALKSLNELSNIYNSFTDGIISCIFLYAKRSVTFDLFNLGRKSRFSHDDEKLYFYYEKLMKSYGEAIKYYDENSALILNKDIKSIVYGIYSVLVSRISMNGETEENIKNPITVEKKEIINNYVGAFLKEYEIIAQKCAENLFNESKPHYFQVFIKEFGVDFALGLINEIEKEMEKEYFKELYGLEADAEKQILISLNDIENRQQTKYYMDLLEKEIELLSTIIKIQVKAIEVNIRLNGVRLAEKQVVDGFLNSVADCYEEISGFLKEELYHEQQEIQSYEQFLSKMKERLDAKEIFPTQIYEKFKQRYDKSILNLENSIKMVIALKIDNKLNKNAFIYELNKIISENANLAMELTLAFKSCAEFIDKNKEIYCENEICKGIYETINIKIEGLTEAINDFKDDCGAFLEDIKKEEQIVSEDEKAEVVNYAYDILISNEFGRNLNLKALKELIANCISNERCGALIEVIEKYISGKKQAVLKKASAYKKDNLLYEMSTFEEIVNYSVSRLRENDDEMIGKFVDCIDETLKTLLNVLSKHNIMPIIPAAYEQFDGKEHEVIMAEKQEGFSKGQIIKVMNTGYKQDGIVLMRANVIAAK